MKKNIQKRLAATLDCQFKHKFTGQIRERTNDLIQGGTHILIFQSSPDAFSFWMKIDKWLDWVQNSERIKHNHGS